MYVRKYIYIYVCVYTRVGNEKATTWREEPILVVDDVLANRMYVGVFAAFTTTTTFLALPWRSVLLRGEEAREEFTNTLDARVN